MKKIFALLLTLCLLPGLALAESSLIFGAVVQPAATYVLKAPASGELAPFSAREGDVAHENDLLFEIEPTNVYADVAGTVALVNAETGDSADAAVSRFGSVMLVEYDERYEIHTNTRTGYNNADNRKEKLAFNIIKTVAFVIKRKSMACGKKHYKANGKQNKDENQEGRVNFAPFMFRLDNRFVCHRRRYEAVEIDCDSFHFLPFLMLGF